MLEAIQAVLPAAGTKKLSAYLLIRRQTVFAFNGEKILSAPIAAEFDFAPKARAFYRAIKRCKETIALWLSPEGVLFLKSGDFTAEIETAPLESFPDPIPPGLWFNAPKPRKPAVPKAQPPEPVWLAPGYLPGLTEAKAFAVDHFTTAELIAAAMASEPLICDVEIFKNYCCVCFTSVVSGKVFVWEQTSCEGSLGESFEWIINSVTTEQDTRLLRWVLEHFLIVTFNGNFFDLPILALILAGWTCAKLKFASDQIIGEQLKPWQVLRSAKVKKLNINHIDLIEVCPLDGSLKLYAGRLHAPRLQDLPFPHDAILSDDQIAIVRYYCVNDLCGTAFCFVNLREQIELRQEMSKKYGQDLRSKSDAQIAESVINGEMMRLTFAEPERPTVAPGTKFKYKTPAFISFQTPMMQRFLAQIQALEFVVSETGYIELPIDPATGKTLEIKLNIADATYTVGMGGLHSTEEVICHKADAETQIFDRDVTSYYPSIILNLGLYPLHLGTEFLQVYRSLVQRRVEAKANQKTCKLSGDKIGEQFWKVIAETLKIVVNGSFGKFGSKWSTLYSPDLLMTVTITGQLSLLMLIECLELCGIKVCSANTDGIVVKCRKDQRGIMLRVFHEWEKETGFATEETEYAGIYSRDVNNYIAVKTDGKTKAKGAYFNPWQSDEYKYERFKKNPVGAISVDAVVDFLAKGVPVKETIAKCADIRKFVSVRTVRAGGVKDGVYLGKVVRWYHAIGETGHIVYAKTGNKVATTDGARPLMDLPATVPADLDRSYYETEAVKILAEIGVIPGFSGAQTVES